MLTCCHPPEVCGQQNVLILFGKLVIDGEIAEVEEAIAHPRVFPIDDSDDGAVIDEVRVEQVVVAEHRRLLTDRLLDGKGQGLGALVRGRQAAAVPDRRQRIGLNHPERREHRRQLARLMDATHGVRDPLQHDAIVDLHICDRASLDEASDERAFRFDEGDDLRTHARDRCQPAGLMLDRPVDA